MSDFARGHGKARWGQCALCLAVGTAVLVPGVAWAQEDVRGQTVSQRPRPAYDPIGLPLGGFRLYPALEVTETYDDNVFGRDTGELDDFITVIVPSFRLSSNWSRHELELRGVAAVSRYIDFDQENTVEYSGGASGRIDLAFDGTIDLDVNYARTTVDRTDPEEAQRVDPEQAKTLSGRVAYTQRFARLATTLGGQVLRYEAEDDLDENKNRTEYGGRFRAAYIVSPAINVFVEPYYTIRDFEFLDFGINRDSDLYGANAGIGYDITGIIYGETAVGYYNVDFEDGRFDSNNGFSVRSETTWNVTPLTSVITTIARENVITNNALASSRTRLSFDLQIEHELLSNLILRAGGTFAKEKFVETQREDDNLDANVGADLLLNNNFALFAEYQYSQRDSTFAGNDFSLNQFTIGIRARL